MNVESNHRAYVRLTTEVEKLKKQMSANATKLPLNIECLMDDKDVTSNMCRADFEAMSKSLLERVERTLRDCLKASSKCYLHLFKQYGFKITSRHVQI